MRFLNLIAFVVLVHSSGILFSEEKLNLAPYLDSVAVFDPQLKYTRSGDTLFIRYFEYGHVLEVVNGRLTRIIPYDSSDQKNGFEVYVGYDKRNRLHAKFYQNGKTVRQIPYVTLSRKELKNIDSNPLSNPIPLDLFAINDTLNSTFQSRFFIDEYDQSHFIYGNNQDHFAYMVFVKGEIKLIGVMKSIPDSLARLNHSCFIFHDNELQFKLNFNDSKLDGQQTYFVGNISYQMHYAAGKFVYADSVFYNPEFYKKNAIAYKLWNGQEPQLKIDFDYFHLYIDQRQNDIQWRYHDEYQEK